MQISCCRSELTSFDVFVVNDDDGSNDVDSDDVGDHESLSETQLLSLSLSPSLSLTFFHRKWALKINPW